MSDPARVPVPAETVPPRRVKASRAKANRAKANLTKADYEALASFRLAMRRFLAFSQSAAEAAGLTARQHQALLAIKGFPGSGAMTIGELADRLLIRHHSAVELADRLAQAGLVTREHDPIDRRRVRLSLTKAAEAKLQALSGAHLGELRAMRPALAGLLDAVSRWG